MRFRSLALDGGVTAGAGAWFLGYVPTFDQTMHVVGTLLIVGTLAVRFAIALRAWRRGKDRDE
jgi:hypothetical protein